MRKLIAAINMTLDGFCDHTALIADDEIHQHYSDLLSHAGAIDNITKIVFSHTLTNVEWKNAKSARGGIKEEILELRQSRNGGSKNLLVGSPGLIVSLMKLNLIDEYQLCVHRL